MSLMVRQLEYTRNLLCYMYTHWSVHTHSEHASTHPALFVRHSHKRVNKHTHREATNTHHAMFMRHSYIHMYANIKCTSTHHAHGIKKTSPGLFCACI